MKVLFLSSQVPFRETRFGGAKRLYYLARELDARTDLHLVCLDGCNEFVGGYAPVSEFRNMLFLPSRPKTSLSERFDFLPGVAGALEDGHEKLKAFLGETRFDATLLAFPAALHFLNQGLVRCPGKIVYLEDDLLLEQYRKTAGQARAPVHRLIKTWRYRQAARFYKKNLTGASTFASISEQEAAIARALHPKLSVQLLGYGLPLEEYPVSPRSMARPTLGFIGNYRHTPNVDAGLWLASELFPEVRKELPEARLILCGTNVPRTLRDVCGKTPGIDLLEDIPDIARFYDQISVFINPVREGRGLRTKVVEAAAFGRPILTTPLGAEGLESFHMKLFVDGASLKRGLRALESPQEWQKAVDHNRAIVEADFSMRAVGATLMDILDPTPPDIRASGNAAESITTG